MAVLKPKKGGMESTPQQTIGPYHSLGLIYGDHEGRDNDLTSGGGKGEEIVIQGCLYAGNGKPVFNVMVEVWQPNSEGIFNHPLYQNDPGFDPNFVGFGRDVTDENGGFKFKTFKPGVAVNEEHPELSLSPNIIVMIHASGLDHPLFTRIYFEDEDNDDFIINQISEGQRESAVAKVVSDNDGEPKVYEFDIIVDGDSDDLVLDFRVAKDDINTKAEAEGRKRSFFYHYE